MTTLGDWRAGSEVNLEVDLMARYAARLERNEIDPSFRGAHLCANPESITTIVSMDSGPAPRGASRNDGILLLLRAWLHTPLRLKAAQRNFRLATKMADARRAALKDQTDISGARILIVEARFYDDIQDALLEGALAEIRKAKASP